MKRYCQHKWFGIFPFIMYSTQEDGIYCLCCALFPVKPVQGSSAKMMITKPYSNWKDDFKAHSVLEYHQNAMALMTSFKWTMLNPATRISDTLSENSKQQVQRNRTLLKSIIKAVEMWMPEDIVMMLLRML